MASKTSEKPPRRTNAERSATTRGKLIDAAIEVLYRSGYTAATTVEVAKRARVSRGAMLHQFPTRVDMLLAVAKHIIEANSAFRRQQLGPDAGVNRFFAAADVSWALHNQPSAIALLEILMATRSDAELRKGIEPFRKLWIEGRVTAAQRMASDLSAAQVEDLEVFIMVQQACLRGLAIEFMFLRDSKMEEKARELLNYYNQCFADKVGAKSAKADAA